MGRKKTTESDPSTMTDDELIAFHAREKARFAAELREKFARYGTTLGPVAPATVPTATTNVVPLRQPTVKFPRVGSGAKPNPQWEGTQKTCPNCNQTKHVVPDFGVLRRGDWEFAYSWCRACRGTVNYRKVKRTYKTRNGNPGEDR